MHSEVLRPLILAIGVSVFGAVAPLAAQSVHTVPPGGDLQGTINAAQPGDTITLAPGATYVGNFVLPAKGGSAFITIRSATPDGMLPADGARINPGFAPLLAKLRSPNGAPALATALGASHYRIQLLEFLPSGQGSGTVIALGDGSSRQNNLDAVAHSLVLDRVYVHGDPGSAQRRGIALNSGATEIINSWVSDIKSSGVDSQAIAGWNGPGPYRIANNYLEAAGENVMFGGADPAIPGLVPSDITLVGNHFAKPLAWRSAPWLVKNLFELKSAQRVVVDRNLFEHNWAAGQAGYAILLKSVNQDGGAPWSVVQQVQFTNNVVRNVSSAINILGRDARYPAIEANNISVRNNLFANVSGAAFGGAGRLLLINGGSHITFDHNTAIVDGASAVFADGTVSGFTLTNNVLLDNGAGIKGSGAGTGAATIARFFPGGYVAGNIIAGANPALYPGSNYYPPQAGIGFADYTSGNYRLSPSSPFKHAGTDGSDPGCHFDRLTAMGGTVPPHGPVPQLAQGNAPSSPSGLSAQVSGSTVTLAWSASPGGGAMSYVIEAGTSPGANNVVTSNTGHAGTSVVAHGVASGVYYVRVRAANAGAISPPSNEVTVTVGQADRCSGAPLPPTGLVATVSGRAVRVNWNAPSGGCTPTHYVVLAGSARGLSNLAQASVAGLTLSANAPAGTYHLRVIAVNASGASAASNEVPVTVP